MDYEYTEGDYVYADGKPGEVTCCVPGDGKTPWYFVKFEDGTEDRFTADQLERQ